MCVPFKNANKCDPATGAWYCRVCFHDVRPDLSVTSKNAPRCFVCFSIGDDVTESVCTSHISPSCSVVRLCVACRDMREVDRCFSCWGVSGKCYKCDKNSCYEGRLCFRCAESARILKCYFCKRSDPVLWRRACSSCEDGENIVCHICAQADVRTTKEFNRKRLRGKQSPPRERPPSDGDISTLLRCLPKTSNRFYCRSCFAQQWKGRCYRCRKEWAQRSQSHFCIKCYDELFPDADVGINVFKTLLPPSEWYKRWGLEWFERKYVGMRFPYVTGNHVKYFILDERACLEIAEKVPTWGRHLQRLCGRLEGQVPLTRALMEKIMGCSFRHEGAALTSRWKGGFIRGFCMESRTQLTIKERCRHPRCHALQHQGLDYATERPEGKLCFMELVEAVAAELPHSIAVGDTINSATWGQFIVMDDYSMCWLNDYSRYFSHVCGSSWEKAVALYVRPWFGSHPPRFLTEYLCADCRPRERRFERKESDDLHLCAECYRKFKRKSECAFYCDNYRDRPGNCKGRCVTKTLPCVDIENGDEYVWSPDGWRFPFVMSEPSSSSESSS